MTPVPPLTTHACDNPYTDSPPRRFQVQSSTLACVRSRVGKGCDRVGQVCIRWEDFYAYQHYAQAGAARVARGW